MRHLIVITMLSLVLGNATPAAAQSDTENVEPGIELSEVPDEPVGDIIPRPNSGAAPQNAGERGGALQWLLFGLIVVFLATAVFSITRSSRRAQAARAGGSD